MKPESQEKPGLAQGVPCVPGAWQELLAQHTPVTPALIAGGHFPKTREVPRPSDLMSLREGGPRAQGRAAL